MFDVMVGDLLYCRTAHCDTPYVIAVPQELSALELSVLVGDYSQTCEDFKTILAVFDGEKYIVKQDSSKEFQMVYNHLKRQVKK